MAKNAEDVIELGSSDDEPDPKPKKRKPLPDAMVHIPSNLRGVTIKSPSKLLPPYKPKTIGKDITVTKVTRFVGNSSAGRSNGVPNNMTTDLLKPIKIHSAPIPKITNTVSLSSPAFLLKSFPVIINPSLKVVKPSMPATLKKLPDLVIKKTTINPQKRTLPQTRIKPPKRRKLSINPAAMLMVNLDDDDEDKSSTPSTSNPQWYLRPEETSVQTLDSQEMECVNNKEPEPTLKMIEITIEDSPVKKKEFNPHEIGAELPITIEDSPVKPRKDNGGSEKRSGRSPNSKKMLEYPNAIGDTIEIEIDPIQIPGTSQYENQVGQSNKTEVRVEIDESLVKPEDMQASSTPKKKNSLATIDKMSTVEMAGLNSENEPGEFHPVYQSFINLCFKLENSDDMKKIIEKKVKTYYKQVPKEYTESEAFIELVSSKISAMTAGPENMYFYIKDVVDELNLQRKSAKSTEQQRKIKEKEESDKFLYGENNEYDAKRKRQIRKLEKTLKKLHCAILKLEEQEIDFDDEEDSVYLLTERYKERLVRVHAKFCQLTNTKMPSEPRVQLETRPGEPTGPARRLEKWINKKVPVGTPLPFPDFHDVLTCVRTANKEDKLGWSEYQIMEEARSLFTRCGNKLKRRRQENEWRLAASRLPATAEPIDESQELKAKLDQNKQEAAKKELEVLDKYADRQRQLKLEGEEIGDKEADESPVESEEEDNKTEETSLENRERRKERLKRLINEKSNNAAVEEKENQPAPENTSNSTASNKDYVTNDDKIDESENKGCSSRDVDDTININTEEPMDGVVEELSDRLDSDVDELHLLQKLNSENELNTTPDSSDSETHITLDSSSESDDRGKCESDVISIENSSYSESESRDTVPSYDVQNSNVNRQNDISKEQAQDEPLTVTIEISNPKEEGKKYINYASSKDQNNKDGSLNLNYKNPSTVEKNINSSDTITSPIKDITNEETDNLKICCIESISSLATGNKSEEGFIEKRSPNSDQLSVDVTTAGCIVVKQREQETSNGKIDTFKHSPSKTADIDSQNEIRQATSSDKCEEIETNSRNISAEIKQIEIATGVVATTGNVEKSVITPVTNIFENGEEVVKNSNSTLDSDVKKTNVA